MTGDLPFCRRPAIIPCTDGGQAGPLSVHRRPIQTFQAGFRPSAWGSGSRWNFNGVTLQLTANITSIRPPPLQSACAVTTNARAYAPADLLSRRKPIIRISPHSAIPARPLALLSPASTPTGPRPRGHLGTRRGRNHRGGAVSWLARPGDV